MKKMYIPINSGEVVIPIIIKVKAKIFLKKLLIIADFHRDRFSKLILCNDYFFSISYRYYLLSYRQRLSAILVPHTAAEVNSTAN
jgi:hypothetical protein